MQARSLIVSERRVDRTEIAEVHAQPAAGRDGDGFDAGAGDDEVAGTQAAAVDRQFIRYPCQGAQRSADVLASPFREEPPILEHRHRVSVEIDGTPVDGRRLP